MPERLRVGFLGLGAIGRPIAGHLARGHDLAVWNRTAERAESFATETGATAMATPRAAAEGRQVVFTCLPNSPELEAVLAGPEGLEAGLSRGSLLVDLTSGIPGASRRIAERLAAKGIGFVDAPVSGGVAGAEAGTLTIMLGGTDADVARALPVLQAFGKRIVPVGPVGAGHALKAVHNALIAVNIFALGEGLTALAKAGVAPSAALDVINNANGRSFVSERLVPERVLTRLWPRTFRLALLDKDVDIAVQLAAEQGIDAPLLEAVSGLLHEAHRELGEDADHVEAIRLHERRAGVELRA
ncbi:MAG TPA: NAD(P)-dependent oxidoreductase [Gemmatimonadales bacterium]